MSESVIRIEGLGKMYRIGGRQERYKTLRDSIVRSVTVPIRRLCGIKFSPRNAESIWALKDVSFEVKVGEIVGIIGRNGAGKTTLLKILSRITEPTEGYAVIRGRVGSLLEVGTGFHPELTGRENIYLNGAILGMKRAEINRKFEEIVSFAEIEKHLDTPVKHYSSGMYVRLAFAVAAHLETEILLVDEVLAVGDAAFQKKCLGKIGDVVKEGLAVLFVSHNMAAVQRLCSRTIWLNGGKIMGDGDTCGIVATYMNTSLSPLTERIWADMPTAPGNDKVRLSRASVHPEGGSPSVPATIRTPLVMEFEYWNLIPNTYLSLSIRVYNEQGIMVFNTAPIHEPVWHGRPFPAGLFCSKCFVPGDLLNDGIHTVELLMVKDQGVVLFRQENLLTFEVRDEVERRGDWYGRWAGTVRPDLRWMTEFLTP
jgi:lipopolysaccharide transport system ATP-binding protein